MSAANEAFAELRRAYASLDGDIAALVAEAGDGCRACGRCCTFPPGSPVLYATALERAYLQSNSIAPGPGASAPDGDEGACPCFDPASRRCKARERRAVGCRTYFCADAFPGAETRRRAEELSAQALAEIRDIAERHGLEWDYAPAIERLRAGLRARR